MGFNNEVRKVRDASLPYGQRFRALASAVQLYRPIGYPTTWLYLEHRVGRSLRDDETAMVEAVELLVAARAIRNLRAAEVAARRRAAKAEGRRSPGRVWHEDEAWANARWHGEEAAAARFALAVWRRRREAGRVESPSTVPNGLVDIVLDRPNSWSPRRRAVLDELSDECAEACRRPARRWSAADGRWVVDEDYGRALRLRDLVWQVSIAVDGPNAVMPGTARNRG